VIQFALLFALGFLTAALLGALVAPVVHRRIVRFAEDRLKATTPLTQQEVRAQKDAARAIYAAENVRTSQTLKRERDRTIALMLAREKAEQDARAVRKENDDLRTQIDQMNVEAGDLRSGIRLMEQHIERLKASLDTLETDYASKVEQTSLLSRQLDRVSAELDEVRVLSAAGALQVDELHARAGGLRDERETLREEHRRLSERAKALELKLEQQEARAVQLESRLTTANALLADRDNTLARRGADIDRLAARNKDMSADLVAAHRALRDAGIALPLANASDGETIALPKPEPAPEPAPEPDLEPDLEPQASARIPHVPEPEEIRADAGRFLDRLVAADPQEDGNLREELLRIAAGMTAMTAIREGETSPIPALLARDTGREPARDPSRPTLAERTRSLLSSTS
jgi:uncharacterized phage infection (PIP) family protein YhgE